MDLRALHRNWEKAGVFCPTFLDRLKYLVWLYAKTPKSWQSRTMQIRFSLENPVGNLTLNVRCNHGSDEFIFSEMFEHRYYDFKLPTPPPTILDLGANVGFASLFFAKKYPDADIACVEPMPENISVLTANLGVNGVRARVIPKAISIEDGSVTMQRSEHDYGHKITGIAFGREMTGDTLTVPAITIPSLMSEMGWKRIGLLKVDVEGYEGILLRQKCDWLNYVDAICIECHEGFGEEDLRQISHNYGFHLPRRLPGTWLLSRQ